MSLGYLEKKIFPDVPDLPDLARSGQIWPDLGRLGKFFFQKKKKIFPDLARSGRPRSGDLARSGSIRVWKKSFLHFLGNSVADRTMKSRTIQAVPKFFLPAAPFFLFCSAKKGSLSDSVV